MSRRNVTVKEICKIKSGKRLPKGKSFSTEVTRFPYIRARDIKTGKINTEDLVYLDEVTQKKLNKYIVSKNDIVITVVGASVGDVGYVSEELDGFNLTENAVRLTEFDASVNSLYLLYVLNSKKYWELMQSIAGGSAQPKLGIYKVESIPLELPDLDIQNKIVKIISVYDNLIENNEKQIKLLEEAAQRLYKEWFIDLRFPGHEDVEIVDGIPEGWNIGVLGDIGTFKRGKTITKTKIVEGKVPVISGGLGPAYYHNESNTSSPVITVSGSGANAGFTKLYYTKVFASDCSFVDIEQTPYLYWIYLFLKNNSSRLDMLQKGSAQPHVYAKDINALECVIPIKEVLNLFCEVVGSYFNKIGILEQQIIKLTEARDRLLPKLMSGEIEV